MLVKRIFLQHHGKAMNPFEELSKYKIVTKISEK